MLIVFLLFRSVKELCAGLPKGSSVVEKARLLFLYCVPVEWECKSSTFKS